MTNKRTKKKHQSRSSAGLKPDILDVRRAAEVLTVSVDTVYDLLKSGQLPGRKVGRKWITTRAVLMRWIEETLASDTAQRAIDAGDKAALTKALQSGSVRVKAGKGSKTFFPTVRPVS